MIARPDNRPAGDPATNAISVYGQGPGGSRPAQAPRASRAAPQGLDDRTHKRRQARCVFHCSGCASHFSSLAAFDAHRAGSHRVGRHCLDPGREPRLVARTEVGVCTMHGVAEVGVTVSTLAPNLEERRERLRELSARSSHSVASRP